MHRTRSYLARGYWFALAALTAPLMSIAQTNATVFPTDFSDAVTEASTLWGSIKTFVIGVVVFSIGLAIIKMLRKK